MELGQAIQLISNDHIQQQTGAATWADLGCGTGLFTRALATLLQPGSIIYAADKAPAIAAGDLLHNGVSIKPAVLDFVQDHPNFGLLDGILMANSLHFAADKPALLEKLNQSLPENGCFIIAEYDTDTQNSWVPYPVSFRALQPLFKNAGFSHIEKLQELPSVYGRANIYTALISR